MNSNKFNSEGKCKVCGKHYNSHYGDECPTEIPSRIEQLEAQVKQCQQEIEDLKNNIAILEEQKQSLVEAFDFDYSTIIKVFHRSDPQLAKELIDKIDKALNKIEGSK